MVQVWLPDPPNENPLDEVQASDDIVIPATDTSDTDDDELQYDGYEPLPLGPAEADAEAVTDEDDVLDAVEDALPSTSDSLPDIEPIEKTLLCEVWSGPAPECVDIEMNAAKANEVKLAMANFTLPSSSFPEWAASVPEEQWKQQLISRIQTLQEKRNK